ncbi:hypothetical protein BJ741DRAFT_576668 [Chytriomyces cf. hyalinus JEL632]|nr:hypothetical protein BJ741DRAFT_576668 [Chytriomyces cf. hyalinus JEL632]
MDHNIMTISNCPFSHDVAQWEHALVSVSGPNRRIVALSFNIGDLHQLCYVAGEEPVQPAMIMDSDGVWTAVHSMWTTMSKITNLFMLMRALLTWRAIHAHAYQLDRNEPMPTLLSTGWSSFICLLAEWAGSGGPYDIQFSAVKRYAFSVLQMGLTDLDFDFGVVRQSLVTVLVLGNECICTFKDGAQKKSNFCTQQR